MAYEVTKTIGGRAYRYRVESAVDPVSGKRRNRWTYLGRDGSAAEAAERKPRQPRGEARRRLLTALEELVGERDFADVTADAVAVRAGLAHGTFYRHFRDKRAALVAALEDVRAHRRPLFAALMNEPPASRDAARAGVRELFASILRAQADHPALQRAAYGLLDRDAGFAEDRRARRALGIEKLGDFFASLNDAGFAAVERPDGTAAALLAMFEGFDRAAVMDGVPIDAATIEAALTLADRAVFADAPRT